MTAADRELSGVVRRWLMPGTTTLSDRVLQSAMVEIAATPQRHRPRALRRWRALAPTTRFALVGSAAVAIVATVGIGLLVTRPGPNIGPTVPTQRATPSLTDRRPEPSTSLAPSPASGRVVIDAIEGLVISFEVPPGWSKTGETAVGRPVGRYAPTGPDGVEVSFSDIERIHQYPCTSPENSRAFGTTTADLAAALQPISEYDHTDPVDTTLAGHPGQRLEITLPNDLGDCHPGGPILWTSSGQPTRSGLAGERDSLWILDVDGKRLVVDAMSFAGTSAEDLAAQQRLIDSIQIERVDPAADSTTTVVDGIDGLRITYDLPDGWSSYGTGATPTGRASLDAEVVFGTVERVWQYPCRMPYLSNKSLAGTTPADLVAKLRSAEGYTSSKPVDVDFAGYRGKRIQLQMPASMADCHDFMTEYFVWIGAPDRFGRPDQRDDLRILDVDGIRLVIDAKSFPGTSAGDLAAQQRLIESIRIQRIDAPASPSPNDGGRGTWDAIDGLQITFDLPPGWSQPGGTGSTDQYPTPHVQGRDPGVAVNFYDEIERVMPRFPAGPGVGPQLPECRLPYGSNDDAGTTPADLAAKLQSDPHIAATKPVDVTLAGFSGKRLELQIPDTISPDCYLSQGLPLWIGRPTGFAAARQRDTLWILDVDGKRVLIEAVSFPGTSAEDLAAQQRLIDSIRIESQTATTQGSALAAQRATIDAIDGIVITFDVPDGWSKTSETAFGRQKGRNSPQPPDGVEVSFWSVDTVRRRSVGSITPDDRWSTGTTPSDLVEAFARDSAYIGSAATDTSVAGYRGKRVNFTIPAGACAAPGACPLWVSETQPTRYGLPGERDTLWIVDVDGARLVVDAMSFAGTSAGDLAALRQLVDSIRLERPAS